MASLTVEPKALTDALAAVKPAVNTKSAVQAFAGVRIETSVAGPRMFASNMDASVMRRFAGEHVNDMNVVVPHADMVKVAKAFAAGPYISLAPVPDEHGNVTTLRCQWGSRKVTVRTLRSEHFPPFQPFAGEQLIDANAGELRATILKADKFRSHDGTRPVLTGLHAQNSVLCVTDSYRLMTGKLPGWLPNCEHEVTMSSAGLALAASRMPKDDTRVSVFSANACSWVVWPGTVWCLRNISGQYPNWEQLMPDSWEGCVTAPTASLLAGAKLATQFCTKNAPVRIALNGKCTMSGATPDACTFEEVIVGAQIVKPTDGDFEIGLNPEFLAQALSELGSEQARIRVISPFRPVVIENCERRTASPDADQAEPLMFTVAELIEALQTIEEPESLKVVLSADEIEEPCEFLALDEFVRSLGG